MTYSTESVHAFWALMRLANQKPFLVRRLLQRLENGEIDEREAAEWIAPDSGTTRVQARGNSRSRIRPI